MEKNKNVLDILHELYQIEPGLKKKEEEIVRTIKVLLSSRPKAALRDDFRLRLRNRLLSRFDEVRKPVAERILESLSRRVLVRWVGAAAVVMVVGVTLFINRNSLVIKSNIAIQEYDQVSSAAPARSRIGKNLDRDMKGPAPEAKRAKEDSDAGLRSAKDEIKANEPEEAEESGLTETAPAPALSLLEKSKKAAPSDDSASFSNRPEGQSETASDISAGLSVDKFAQKESRAAAVYENPFRETGTASYSVIETLKDMNFYEKLKKRIESGQPPKAGFVPVSDLVQNFRYSYPRPAPNSDFRIVSETAVCPWNPTNRLLFVGIQAGELSGPVDSVSLRLMFDKRTVRSFRYINSDEILQVNDPDQAGETADQKQIIGPGNQMTLLYEVNLSTDSAKTMGEISVIYGFRNGMKTRQNAGLVSAPVRDIEESSDNFRFAAAVAEWGLLINDSRYKAGADYGNVIRLAESAAGPSADSAERKKFIDLVKKTRDMGR